MPTINLGRVVGRDGVDGKNANINGVNALTIVEDPGINLTQSGNTLKIGPEIDELARRLTEQGNALSAALGSKADVLQSLQTLYVSTSGSDTTGDGSEGKPFATIQKALDTIPKNLGETVVTINVSAGTYPGFRVRSFYSGTVGGTAGVYIRGPGSNNPISTTSGVFVEGCSATIEIANIIVNGNAYGFNFFIANSKANLYNCTCNDTTNPNGMYAKISNVRLYNCTISNKTGTGLTIDGSFCFASYIKGENNNICIKCGSESSGYSGLLIGDHHDITGTTKYVTARGGIIFADGNAIPINAAGISNQNLLINWYFPDPINQRGQTEYTGRNMYTIDGWMISGSKVTLTNDGIVYANSESSNQTFVQYRELECVPHNGETITASAIVDGQMVSMTVQAVLDQYPQVAFGEGGYMEFACRTKTHQAYVAFYLPSGKTAKIKAVKLELGDHQTLAHQDASGNWVLNDPPPNKALELIKCQMYDQPLSNMVIVYPPEMHRKIFRGKNLGTVFTTAQKNAIQNGTFDDLWLGDYWVINGVIWRIVDIDYWYNTGDTAFTKHHLVIMPDAHLYTAQMNDENTTVGGYVGSLMYTTNLEQAKTMATAAFGDAVLSHRELFTNAVANGRPSSGAWMDSTVELPNEIMMYGSHVFAPACDGTNIPYLYTIDKTQLALFTVAPKFITILTWCWLRDVVSSALFASVSSYGNTYCNYASGSGGVRPVFPVG